jgi:nitroimidazol reductase NimA-like FMN-containing flavoprotein (pyridoxamine 5'-phosphate oxidase superfamily)
MRTLGADEIETVLEENGLGVLAFDGGQHPYPVPVAFGHDAATDLFVVQLEGGADSYKHRCLTHNPNVGFTVYEETEPGAAWRSVIVQGRLVEISYQEAEAAFASLARNTQGAPNPVLWDGTADSTDLTPYELDVATRSGREFVIE